MKQNLTTFLFLLIWPMQLIASQPHYYSFDQVLLSEGEITIKAKTRDRGGSLEIFSINTPDGLIELTDKTIRKVSNPKLNTIKMVLMPYKLKGGIRYFHKVSMSFYGDKICEPRHSSLGGNWAPESKLVITFWGMEHEVRIENGQCNG